MGCEKISVFSPIFFETVAYTELSDIIDRNAYQDIFILVDENTKKYCLDVFLFKVTCFSSKNNNKVKTILIKSGEQNKNIDNVRKIWQQLIDLNAKRNTLFLNLGGGVICDMGAFAAATYYRGIDFVNIPTTLLAQVDAAIGAKVGVDFNNIKNIIGLITPPLFIIVDKEYLNTLNKRQLMSGYAEMLKIALLSDRAHWNKLKEIKNIKPEVLTALIEKSVKAKINIVKADPFEKAVRKVLNFGHTIGHAFESYSLEKDKNPLLHGEAVAIGMICEAYISNRCSGLSVKDLKIISNTIINVFPKYKFDLRIAKKLISYMKFDKKNIDSRISFTLLKSVGEPLFNQYCSEDIIIDSLKYYNSL